MQTVGVRMPVTLIAAIDLYRDRLKAQNPAFRIERGEAMRDLLLKALALVDSGGPDDAGIGPVLATVDQSPMEADRPLPKAAQGKDQRTTGRKRAVSAKG
jgi:hypothetical protein